MGGRRELVSKQKQLTLLGRFLLSSLPMSRMVHH